MGQLPDALCRGASEPTGDSCADLHLCIRSNYFLWNQIWNTFLSKAFCIVYIAYYSDLKNHLSGLLRKVLFLKILYNFSNFSLSFNKTLKKTL